MLHIPRLVALAGLLLAHTATMADTLTIAVNGPYRPYVKISDSGELSGFDVDLAQAACARMARECRIVNRTWDRLFTGLESGEHDLVIAGLRKTPERQSRWLFSDAYEQPKARWYGLNTHDFSAPKEPGKTELRLGAIAGTDEARFLKERTEIRVYRTPDDVLIGLERGRIDLALMDETAAEDSIIGQERFSVLGDPLSTAPAVGAAFAPGNERLRDAFSAALEALESEGELARMRQNHL